MSNFVPLPWWRRDTDSSNWQRSLWWPIRVKLVKPLTRRGWFDTGTHGIECSTAYWNRRVNTYGKPCGMLVFAWVFRCGPLRVIFGDYVARAAARDIRGLRRPKRRCEHWLCGKTFVISSPWSRYCSRACYRASLATNPHQRPLSEIEA